MEWIDTDELVKVTPKNYRMRKRMLSEGERKRARRTET
jgi:GTP-binding protein